MTVVNQYPIMVDLIPTWVKFLAFVCLGICAFILVLSLAERNWGLATTFSCFVMLCLGLILWGNNARRSGRNCYECLIDDTTPFVEVAENYDVIGRRGDLWILGDKGEEK